MDETGWVDVPDRNFGHFEVDYDNLPPEGVRFNNLSPRGRISDIFMKLYDTNLHKKLRDFHFDRDCISDEIPEQQRGVRML